MVDPAARQAYPGGHVASRTWSESGRERAIGQPVEAQALASITELMRHSFNPPAE